MAFTYKRSVTFLSAQVPSTQSNFTALISVTHVDLKDVAHSGHVQSASGYDIVPYTDSGLSTKINGFDLEYYDPTTGQVIMWVLISSLSSSSNTVIWLGYGDAGISTYQGTRTASVDSSRKVVYHCDSTTSTIPETISGYDSAKQGGATDPLDSPGKIHRGLVRVANYAFAAPTPELSLGAACTVSAWINVPSGSGVTRYLFVGGTGGVVFICEGWDGATDATMLIGATSDPVGIGLGDIRDDTWHHVAVTYDDAIAQPKMTVFKDGNLHNTFSGQSGNVRPIGANLILGWTGSTVFDQIQIDATARSADWIKAEFRNQNDPAAFHTLGTEQAAGSNRFFILTHPA
jgi:hypothetical protein